MLLTERPRKTGALLRIRQHRKSGCGEAGVQHSYLEFCPILVVRLCPGHLTPLSVFYQLDRETVDTPTLCQVAGMTEDKQAEGLEESRHVGSGRCERRTDDRL